MSSVLSLHVGQGTTLPKASIVQAKLVTGKGVEGDRHFGKHPDLAVLVAGSLTYQQATQAGIELPAGALGENLLVDFDPYQLGSGAHLQIGAVLLELTSVCSVCDPLSISDLRLPKVLHGQRGMCARVLCGGVVQVGDAVGVLASRTA